MSFFNWMKKGVDIEKNEPEVIEKQVPTPQIDESLLRKQRFQKLINGDSNSNLSSQKQTGNYESMAKSGTRQVPVYLIKTNEDLADVITQLKQNKPAIVNLSKVSKNEIQRSEDFLSGVVFALDAHISLFANGIYLITPNGVIIAD